MYKFRKGGQIAGGLAIYNMGQWFGSQSVAIAGIATVGILPEHRGPVTSIHHEVFQQIYRQWAAKTNGHLDRHQAI